MRPYTMHQVIVLLCVLAAADAGALRCDASLIIGALNTEYTYSAATAAAPYRELTCKYKKHVMIKGPTTQEIAYKKVRCNPAESKLDNQRWYDEGQKYVQPKKPSDQQIDMKCETVNDCDPALIRAPDKMTLVGNKLTCSTPNEQFELTVGTKWSKELECDAVGGFWKDGGVQTSFKATEPLRVTCSVPACDFAWITDKSNGKLEKGTPNKLTCPSNMMMEFGDELPDKSMTCDKDNGWTEEGKSRPIRGPRVKVDVKCYYKPCDLNWISEPGGANNLDRSATKEIKCKNGLQMKIGTEKYDLLLCDERNGWNVPGGQPPCIKGPKEKFDATCVPKPNCPHTPSAGISFDSGKLTCTNGNDLGRMRIIYNGKQYESLTCTSTMWKDGVTDVAPSTTKLVVSCDSTVYCAVQQPCDASDPACNSGVKDGLTADASVTSPGEYACTIKKLGEDKNTMMLNGKNMYSNSLKCDFKNGWADVTGKVVEANALTKVKIACEKAKCSVPGVKACDTDLKGYICKGEKNERSPFGLSNDPNFLNCDKDPMRILYDYSKNQEYDFKLKCKEGLEWYRADDPDEKPIVDESNNARILCLQKRCNICPTNLPVLSSASSGTFEAGTATTCATTKCPNNLWKIKKGAHDPEEEYAGEVTCYSTYNPTTNIHTGIWIIDGDEKLIVTEGSCIDSVTSCVSAAALNIKCDTTWASFGCKELTLDNEKQLECGTGKTMFFKRKGQEYFDEGKTIKCDKTKGNWKMTDTEALVRGDTVICADSNPNPVPTTTPPPNACERCLSDTSKPNGLKEADITKDDSGEICTIARIDKGKFHTDVEETDKLMCNKTDVGWKTDKGNSVARIEGGPPKEEEQESQMMYIVGGAVFGVIVLLIVFAVIFKVCISGRKKRDDKDEETKRKMLEDEKKKKKKAGDNNDEILDEQSVDAPSELKL